MNCGKELKKPGTVDDFALAGDGSWVVIRPNSFVTSTGVDSDLADSLKRFYRQQKRRRADRQREIQTHDREVERERQEREQAEREAREAREREAREIEQTEQAEREARERGDREMAERLAKEEADRNREASTLLANAFEEHIREEAKSIEVLQQILQKRQRSLKGSIDKLPPEKRARMVDEVVVADASDRTDCVVCHSAAAVRAVIPCGHQCLCDDCAVTVTNLGEPSRLCPLCRTSIDSTLKIYAPR